VQVAAATPAYSARVPVPATARTHSKVTGLFGGLPLLAPGVAPVTEWRPEVGDPFGQPADLHGGVTRIPRRARTVSLPFQSAHAADGPGQLAHGHLRE